MSRASPATAWTRLRRSLGSLGLGWAFHQLPPQLRVARTPDFPRGVETAHLLPAAWHDFVDAVGYPVVGFSYYCRVGLSFLPAEHLEVCSTMVADQHGNLLDSATRTRPDARAAFFAGTELSDLVGWSFAPEAPGRAPCVWTTEGSLVEPVGSFERWAVAEADRIESWARSLSAGERKRLEEENDGEDDPHRALDYALDVPTQHEGFSAADLRLHWVCDQSKSPYRWSLIDDAGTWLLRPGKPFDRVAPFRGGKAQVERGGRVLLIDTGGKTLEDVTPAKPSSAPASLSLKGLRVILVGSFRVMGVSLGEFERHVEAGGGTLLADPTQAADIYVVGRVEHFPEYFELAKERQRAVPATRLIPLEEFLLQIGLTSG